MKKKGKYEEVINNINRLKWEIGNRIREEREKLGLSQEEFSEKVLLSKVVINNFEQGKGSFKIEQLYTIASFCGCDIGYLLGEIKGKTYDVNFILDSIGLSEEAINHLRKSKKFIERTGKDPGLTSEGLKWEVINDLITSDKSPLYEMGEFKDKRKRLKDFEKKPYFKKAINALEEAKKEAEEIAPKEDFSLAFDFSVKISFMEKMQDTFPNCGKELILEILSDALFYDICSSKDYEDLEKFRLQKAIEEYLNTY